MNKHFFPDRPFPCEDNKHYCFDTRGLKLNQVAGKFLTFIFFIAFNEGRKSLNLTISTKQVRSSKKKILHWPARVPFIKRTLSQSTHVTRWIVVWNPKSKVQNLLRCMSFSTCDIVLIFSSRMYVTCTISQQIIKTWWPAWAHAGYQNQKSVIVTLK